MGLDQYAYVKEDGKEDEPNFIWRKHSKLQEWAESLFVQKTGEDASALNCSELPLDQGDIDGLQTLLTNGGLPKSEGGFFYGHQFQDEQAEQYSEQDLEFGTWASEMISDGRTVVYSCWW